MNNGVYRRRHLVNKVMLTISRGALLFGLFLADFWIIATLLVSGARPRCRSRCSRNHAPARASGLLQRRNWAAWLMARRGHP